MTFAIRPYHPGDLFWVYQICAGWNPESPNPDPDPDLVGQYYAAAYAYYEPDLCFILTNDDKPCGYILGTRDSTAFWERCDREWFPPLRRRFPVPSPEDTSGKAKLIRRFNPTLEAHPPISGYPAHLHIQILPIAQGQKLGHRMMEAFIGRLEELGVAGLHLGTSTSNTRAVGFYDKMGFQRLIENQWNVTFGMRLPRKPAPLR